ncbi:hypothetical protein [Photobacterium swingsii]|uniref:hypothetical protein n=1 Tax=Photobacterium swingsii TaxID=680026 RepID=UPI004067DCC1
MKSLTTAFITISLALTTFLFSAIASASAGNTTPQWLTWQSVGYAKLTWGPWDIYHSELRTPSGSYSGNAASGEQNMALVIRYQRDIDKDDLLEATDDQWKHLGFSASQRQQWLSELAVLWPDVKKGDRLIFELNAQGGTFYFDANAKHATNKQGIIQLGQLSSPKVSSAFINIWLSPQTAYPKLRQQLIGQSS